MADDEQVNFGLTGGQFHCSKIDADGDAVISQPLANKIAVKTLVAMLRARGNCSCVACLVLSAAAQVCLHRVEADDRAARAGAAIDWSKLC